MVLSKGVAVANRAIEIALVRIVNGLDVSDAAVAIDCKSAIWHDRAADAIECGSPGSRLGCLFVYRRLEVVQQVELEIVDDRGRDLIPDGLPCDTGVGSASGGTSTVSSLPFSAMPAGVITVPSSRSGCRPRGPSACRPISLFRAPMTNSRIDIVPPCAKNGRTRRSVSTPLHARDIRLCRPALP